MLRQQVIPMLKYSGLIREEQDQKDKRKILIYPTSELTVVSDPKNYSEMQGRVEKEISLDKGDYSEDMEND